VPPEYLVDRNIGSSVITSLRAAGLTVHSLADLYGNDRSQQVTDPEWITLAGRRGFVALTKDKRIRHRPAESEAVLEAGVHLFALVAGNANLRETAAAFLAAEPRMAEIAANCGGGVIWVVHRDGRIVRQWPAE
jgi:hypothetical protein